MNRKEVDTTYPFVLILVMHLNLYYHDQNLQILSMIRNNSKKNIYWWKCRIFFNLISYTHLKNLLCVSDRMTMIYHAWNTNWLQPALNVYYVNSYLIFVVFLYDSLLGSNNVELHQMFIFIFLFIHSEAHFSVNIDFLLELLLVVLFEFDRIEKKRNKLSRERIERLCSRIKKQFLRWFFSLTLITLSIIFYSNSHLLLDHWVFKSFFSMLFLLSSVLKKISFLRIDDFVFVVFLFLLSIFF